MFLYEGDASMGMNIRIIKLERENDTWNPFSKREKYSYFLTEGYTKGQKDVKHIHLKYCPFCGTELSKFYKDDKYVNESDLSFLR